MLSGLQIRTDIYKNNFNVIEIKRKFSTSIHAQAKIPTSKADKPDLDYDIRVRTLSKP